MSARALALSNRLPVLADEVKHALLESDQAAKTAAARSIDAGKALIEAKGICAHGQWLPWLISAGIHERTAQRYMILAVSDLESDTVSLLGGVTPALRFLRLRAEGMRHFDAAEAAALAIQAGAEGPACLTSITLAMDCIEQMVGMFPPGEGGDVV